MVRCSAFDSKVVEEDPEVTSAELVVNPRVERAV